MPVKSIKKCVSSTVVKFFQIVPQLGNDFAPPKIKIIQFSNNIYIQLNQVMQLAEHNT